MYGLGETVLYVVLRGISYRFVIYLLRDWFEDGFDRFRVEDGHFSLVFRCGEKTETKR